jgi:SnoaL-like domain
MKNFFAATLLLFSFGCTSRHSEELTQEQTDEIKSEVKAVADSAIARFKRMDWTGALQFYANTPDWVMINADGSQWDYQTTAKAFAGLTDINSQPVTAWTWTTTRQNFLVVNKDVVILAWVGKDKTTMKSGDIIVYDPHVYTMVFKRIAGQWKVVWSHDSGIPVTQKAVGAHRPQP